MRKKRKIDHLDRIDLDYSVPASENLASSIVHMVGFGLNLTTAALLIVFSALKGNTVQIISFAVFAAFLNIYFIFSVLFHSLTSIEAKKVFKVLERCAGYLLLTGIFIPITLIAIGGSKGLLYLIIFAVLNLIAIINTAIYGRIRETLTALLHIFIFIYLVIFFILTYPLVSIAFMIWLGIALVLFLIGLIMEDMKGIRFHHALGHGCFLLANLSLFFGFFFHLI